MLKGGRKERADVSFIYLCIRFQKRKHRKHFKNKNRNQLHKSEKTLFFFLLKIDFIILRV